VICVCVCVCVLCLCLCFVLEESNSTNTGKWNNTIYSNPFELVWICFEFRYQKFILPCFWSCLNPFEFVLNSVIRFIEFMELVMNDLMKYFYKYCPTPVAQWLRRQSKLLTVKGSCLTCLGMGTPNILYR
jgi:hypothetical protein